MPCKKPTRKTTDLSIFQFDLELRQQYPVIAGIDEAGRGPLAGPVVAAGVVLYPDTIIDGLRDSKKIPAEKERKKLLWEIIKKAVSIGVGIVDADVIDRVNILEATKLAMKRAVGDLNTTPDLLLIDAVKLPDVLIQQRSIIKGESISASIAAASIIAKVVRDDIMLDYHVKYPAYNFKDHKGYCTKEHIEYIREYGPCAIHRRSFRKVADVRLPL